MKKIKNKKIKVILWDFDGVLINSNSIRDYGFEQVLKGYPRQQVEQLIQFHKTNGGLSRYVKFRYFFETIRGETLTDIHLNKLVNNFSAIMRKSLVNESLLITENINFIKNNFQKYNMHIVSGSDQSELRDLCKALNISCYFKSIYGSPVPKNNLVSMTLEKYNYSKSECILIGDSINDYEAAKMNKISFEAFNNPELIKFNTYQTCKLFV